MRLRIGLAAVALATGCGGSVAPAGPAGNDGGVEPSALAAATARTATVLHALTPDDGGTAVHDTGSVAHDTGSVAHDTGVAAHDTGSVARDTGVDTGVAAPHDTGVDTGVAPRDTGVDTGVVARDSGVDTGVVARDTGVAVPDVGPVDAPPPAPGVVPRIDAATKARLRAVFLAGQARGNRANVFAKIGDSITESSSFLMAIGCGWANLGAHAGLQPIVDYYRAWRAPPGYTTECDTGGNSFNVSSASAMAGWAADAALLPLLEPPPECTGENVVALRCEYTRLRPAVALVMYGTNDLLRYNDVARYRTSLERIVETSVALGVIPVLSTIPPRIDDPALSPRVGAYNAVVVAVASEQRVPLWNYHRALTATPGMVNQGLSEDGVHPSVYGGCRAPLGCASANFTAEGLRYGYNQRNLTALQVLAHVKAVVLDDGPAD